jgi:DNA-binding NtrC family response regulator
MRVLPNLLLADDEPGVLTTLGMILELDGYSVTRATSAADAIRHLSNGVRYDVVITDLNMEGPDIGLEVARKALGITPRPVVCICTGYADTANAREALEMHVDYFATKPVDIDEFRAAISRLRKQRKLSSKHCA